MIPIRYNLRSLMVRRATAAMTASVVALVVMLLFILSGFVAGLRATVMSNASPDNYIVLSRGTTNEGGSFISHEQYEIIKSRPQIATTSDGQALVSPEVITGFNPDPAAAPTSGVIFTFLRGLYPVGYQVHGGMRVESGRWPNRGTAEMVVGRKLVARYPNLAVGNDFKFGARTFKIVGVFSDGDSARESEMLTDLSVLTQEVHVANGFEVLHVVLKPGAHDDFAKSLTTDSRVRVDAMPEQEFYAKQTEFVDQLRALGLIVALILAVGSVFGAMNTMYSAVARRTSEIGVLRVLGFSRFNVLTSFVIESIVLAIAGGVLGEVLGVLVAYSTGLSSQLMNVGEFIFRFRLTLGAFVSGMVAALIIGALGGLLPAWRASRIGLVDSLRSV
ncbi:MAG TPA: FtsX-like permease family protein [Candidatus Acidoferrum sp.]|nr:FtsX-like permease family protein [Candidatus Acidoferrum sp.]